MHISQILTKRLGDKFRLSSSASFPCWQASHPAALIHASIHKVSAHRNSSQICPPHTRLNSFYSSGGCLKMPFSRPTLPRPLNIHFWLFSKLPCLQIKTRAECARKVREMILQYITFSASPSVHHFH